MEKVVFNSDGVIIDGVKTQIISGTIHYFRVKRELWQDRLLKAKQCGLNAIETYMPWNLHEKQKGIFDFSDNLDIAQFIREIHNLGMYVIVRPGPYICAEWDNGGLPAYLTVEPGIEFRCMNEPYLTNVKRYLDQVIPILQQFQYPQGPVIAIQVENEYGSYGRDKNYLRYLRNEYLNGHINVPLFTSDGSDDMMMQGGTIPECFMTLNFGSEPLPQFAAGKKYRPDSSAFCMEYWNGWFDHWGTEHHTRDAQDAAKVLDEMLQHGASVNFYMFHGGTNFGFTNGANGMTPQEYMPTVTSYDYDAALTECGDPTEKYFAFQQIIKKYRPNAPFGTPKSSKKIAYGRIQLSQTADLIHNLDNLAESRHSVMPKPMEYFGQNFGFIHYRTSVTGPLVEREILFFGLHDRVQIFVNGEFKKTIYRNDSDHKLNLAIPENGAVIDLLVENMGRINYGPYLGRDLKGIDKVKLGSCFLPDWTIWNLPMEKLNNLEYKPFYMAENRPAFYRGTFIVNEIADTFLEFPGQKGIVFINGFNLGRYWNIGPGKTLYVPSAVLKTGENEIIVLELHHLNNPTVNFCNHPHLA